MKIEINREIFMKTVGNSVGFIDEHAVSDIFKNFLIEVVNNNQIAITATDANAHTGIISILNVESMMQPESFLVKAKKLNGILKSLENDDNINLELNEKSQLIIKSGRAKFEIASSSISEYIDRPEVQGKSFELNIGKLLFLIKKVWFAISPDMSRPKMRAGYLKYEDGKLVMIGTDAFQLAYADIEVEEDLSEFLKDGILIAKEDLVRLRKILEVEDPSSNMKVTLQDNTISLEINNPRDSISTTIWLRLLGTEYVSYSVIFRDKGNEIVIEKQKLKSVLKRAAQALSKDSPILKFTVSADSLLINSNDEYSSFSETMEVSYKAENTLLGVSSRYLNEMVPLIDSQFIVLDILTDEDVIIIHPVSDDETKDRKYFYILMPMDLN